MTHTVVNQAVMGIVRIAVPADVKEVAPVAVMIAVLVLANIVFLTRVTNFS